MWAGGGGRGLNYNSQKPRRREPRRGLQRLGQVDWKPAGSLGPGRGLRLCVSEFVCGAERSGPEAEVEAALRGEWLTWERLALGLA